MGQWRTMAVGFLALIPVAVYGAAETSVWVVLPPLVAAALVLLIAAAAVDYFGIARRRVGWSGVSADPRRAWMRARALEHRFDVQKRRGSPRTLSMPAVDVSPHRPPAAHGALSARRPQPPTGSRVSSPSTRRQIPSGLASCSSSGSTAAGAFCHTSGRRKRRIAVMPTDVWAGAEVAGYGPP